MIQNEHKKETIEANKKFCESENKFRPFNSWSQWAIIQKGKCDIRFQLYV